MHSVYYIYITSIMIDFDWSIPLFFLLRAQKDHVDLIVDCVCGTALHLIYIYGCASMYMHGTW